MYGCVGGRSYPQKLIIQPMLAYLNPAANVCWHIPGGTRVTFITASERSWVQFPEVILIIFDTNCSKQWGPRGAGAVTGNCQLIPGKEQTIGNRLSCVLELRAKFSLVAKFSLIRPSLAVPASATFVERHCNVERRIQYVTSIVHMFSTLISSTKPTLPQVSNLKCHGGLLWAPRLN